GPFWQRMGAQATQLGNTPSPTLLHSPFDVFQHRIVAEISVGTATDNDSIGFAVGFDSGETRRLDLEPEYLYIDWKKSVDQLGETSAPAGLAISRVFGIPSVADFANHVNTTLSGPTNGLEELARGQGLGATGWEENRTYRFEFELRPNGLRVWVDGNLEFDLVGPMEVGRFACMSFSQEQTTCGNIVVEALPDGPLLDLGDEIPTREGEEVQVPLRFDAMGNELRRASFGIDYDEACLNFNPVDANFDGRVDGLAFVDALRFSSEFVGDVDFDASRTGAELLVTLADTVPLTGDAEGLLANLTLTNHCGPLSSTEPRTVPVRFAADSEFETQEARLVPVGELSDGSVLILPRDAGPAFVDLTGFTAETYPVLPGTLARNVAPIWDVFNDGSPFSVLQLTNTNPTVFYSPTDVAEARISFEVVAQASADTDSFGFAVGFEAGDSTNAAAEYILIDWRQAQDPASVVALFAPEIRFTGGEAGLRASRVFGVPTNFEFIEQDSFDEAPYTPNSGLEVLASATTLGTVGWENGRVYAFTLELEQNRLAVYVDGVLEIELARSFGAAPFAFYNSSQERVMYRNLTIEPVD
ncbi:MAG: hypothetical protein AAF899_17910, partial [Pseudomonadota bacterium]